MGRPFRRWEGHSEGQETIPKGWRQFQRAGDDSEGLEMIQKGWRQYRRAVKALILRRSIDDQGGTPMTKNDY